MSSHQYSDPSRALCLYESLSELREYTEGLGEPTEADSRDHCSPQSGQSVISLLSAEELKKLIEEVKVLDEATLKVGFLYKRPQGPRPYSEPRPERGRSPWGRDRASLDPRDSTRHSNGAWWLLKCL